MNFAVELCFDVQGDARWHHADQSAQRGRAHSGDVDRPALANRHDQAQEQAGADQRPRHVVAVEQREERRRHQRKAEADRRLEGRGNGDDRAREQLDLGRRHA